MNAAQKALAFQYKPLWQRSLIIFAGPAFNYLFAVLALVVLFVAYGQPYTSTVISEVQEASPAAEAGLQAGDKIVAINGRSVTRFEEIKRVTSISPNETLKFDVMRGDETLTLPITPGVSEREDITGKMQKVGQIGIMSKQVEVVTHAPLTALRYAVHETWDLTLATFKAIKQIIVGSRSTEDLGGPLRIAQMSGEVAEAGFSKALFFTALLSINLGLINLFPLPPLDGGHLVFHAYEAIFRREPHEKVQNAIVMGGVAAVLLLMIMVTWNDLIHLNVVEYVTGLVS